MRRHRRVVITERVIPYLAAFVGLVALAGAVIVELDAQQRAERVSEELARLRAALDLVSQRTEAVAEGTADNGVAAALSALQDRMARLEQEWESTPPAISASPGAGAAGIDPAAAAAIDPNLPITDCIPVGTRFMGVTGERYAICQSPAVVGVSAVTDDSVVIEGAGVIVESTSAALAGTNCTLMVFSADIEGFAEMRVTCQ